MKREKHTKLLAMRPGLRSNLIDPDKKSRPGACFFYFSSIVIPVTIIHLNLLKDQLTNTILEIN